MVLNLNSEGLGSDPKNFIVYNSKLYFTADDGIHGRELHVYDGINESSLVADLLPGTGSSDPDNLCVFNGQLYFRTRNESYLYEYWVFDGNNIPIRVTEINPGWQDLITMLSLL
jgi:ELWxxDGT repeat protein